MPTRRAALAAIGAVGATLATGRARAQGASERVLILGGDLAEIAFALGAGDRIIGTDDTALWPPEAAALPKVGYLRQLSAEGVLSLAADLVLASADAGPPAVMGQLRSAGIAIESAPGGEGFDSVAPKIAFVGKALGLDAEAAALSARVADEMRAVEAALETVSDQPTVLFLISVANGAPMASGTGTAADAMIRLARGTNAVDGFDGYKPLSAESALGLAPDFVLVLDHVAGPAGGALAALEAAGLSNTPAGRNGRAIAMDGQLLLGFGPRTPMAVAYLARMLHPDAAERPKL